MSGIKQWSVPRGVTVSELCDGDYVTHADHLASHAFDSDAECDLVTEYLLGIDAERVASGYPPTNMGEARLIITTWLDCAQSRAKRFGCTEQTMEPDKLDRPDIGDYAKRTAEDLRRRLDK